MPACCRRRPLRLACCVPLALVALGLAACSATGPSSRGAGAGPRSVSPRSLTTGPGTRASAGGPSTAPDTTSTTSSTSPSTTGTQQVVYSPYTAQGTADPSLHVTQTVSGSCVGSGVAGADSYRCFGASDNEIFDPCFAPPGATHGPLLCVPAPDVSDVVEFDVGALPASTPASHLWAMELADGQVCVLVDAAWSGLGPFACPSPTPSGSLADCHAPARGPDGWTALCQATEASSSPFASVRVATVYT